jgi:hypothetical protein
VVVGVVVVVVRGSFQTEDVLVEGEVGDEEAVEVHQTWACCVGMEAVVVG